MKRLSLVPLLLCAFATPTLASEQVMMIASIDSPSILFSKPADLDRHTSKVAEFRMHEINDDIGLKIDALLKEKMDKNLSAK